MSDYIEQNTTLEPFGKNESWLILSSIERSIKKKVEKNGIPLKDWDIQIYRGVLTGYNKAFIIDEKRKNELILEDPKSAEIIRPILRGRDIDRYGYKFADLYLICTFPAKNLNIDDFPAIKKYLLSFGKRKLSQSGEKNIDGIQGNNARKRTTNQWFETQDSISYWDDFNKPKMIWKRIGSKLRFCLDTQGFYCLDSTCIATGSCISFLVALLNTTMGNYLLKDSPKTGTGDLIVSVQALLPIKVPRLSQKDQKEYESLLASIIECINNDQDYKSYERKLESLAFQMYGLTDTEKEYVIQTVNELYR
ncbi:TaqI-like C-terminal specificity domain-containing protein [Lactobacillus porci]